MLFSHKKNFLELITQKKREMKNKINRVEEWKEEGSKKEEKNA